MPRMDADENPTENESRQKNAGEVDIVLDLGFGWKRVE